MTSHPSRLSAVCEVYFIQHSGRRNAYARALRKDGSRGMRVRVKVRDADKWLKSGRAVEVSIPR